MILRYDPGGGGLTPEQAFALGGQALQAGRLAEAEQRFRQVLARHPAHADSLHLLGLVQLQAGRAEEAAQTIGKALALQPSAPQFHNNLGSALRSLGRLAEAEAAFRKAVALRPDYGRAMVNLGQTLVAQGRTTEAAEQLRRALRLLPGDLDANWSLALLLHGANDFAGAAEGYRRVIHAAPQAAEPHDNLGRALVALGRRSEGAAALRRALELEPTAERWCVLASLLQGDAQLTQAVEAYRQALRLAPGLAAAYNGLANALTDLGRLDEAVAAYREAVRLDPDHLSARSNLIMTLHSLASVSAADILVEARAYAARVEPRATPAFANDRDPVRRLRVGYVSADLRVHPVGFFLDRVLPSHDPAQVEAVLYSDTLVEDAQTHRLQAASAGWRPIAGLSDAEVARQVAEDRIDLLVDLAGHTGSNRLSLFAARAAPVQASWLGYFGTTGLAKMDHVVADAVVLPPGEEPLFAEAPVRVAAPYLCWSPPQEAVPLAPFPAPAQGFVTFGCFNNRAKVNGETVAAWARILAAVPGSRLFLKSWSLADPACRAGLAEAFAPHGVEPGRLIFEGLSPRAEALAAYNRVDIALDPFPFGGCTTTADTLWMGVPVITLAGGRWSGRMSRTMLECLGLGEWVAADLDAYVAAAVAMAADLPVLAPLRAGLRQRLEASPLCDGPAFTRRLEAAYRDMWRGWCERP